MSIIQCPKCKLMVSTLADKCPHCGCPNSEFMGSLTEESTAEQSFTAPQPAAAESVGMTPAPQPQMATPIAPMAAAPCDIFGKIAIMGAVLCAALIGNFMDIMSNGGSFEPWHYVTMAALCTGMVVAAFRREHIATIIMAILSLGLILLFISKSHIKPEYEYSDDYLSFIAIAKYGVLAGIIVTGISAVIAQIRKRYLSISRYNILDIVMGMMFVALMLMPSFHDWYDLVDQNESMNAFYMSSFLLICGLFGLAAVVGRRYSVALAMAAMALIMQIVDMFYIFDFELDADKQELLRLDNIEIGMTSSSIATFLGTICLTLLAIARHGHYNSVNRSVRESNEMVLPAIMLIITFFVIEIPSLYMSDSPEYVKYLQSLGEEIEPNYTIASSNPFWSAILLCSLLGVSLLLFCRNYLLTGLTSAISMTAAIVLIAKADIVVNHVVAILPIVLTMVITGLTLYHASQKHGRLLNLDMVAVACAAAVLTPLIGISALPLGMLMVCVTGQYKIASVAMSILALILFSNESVYDYDNFEKFNDMFALLAAISKWVFILVPLYAPLRWLISKIK